MTTTLTDGSDTALPLVPRGWYYAGPVTSIRQPTRVRLGKHDYVAFANDGAAHVLDGRCPHFAAKLWRGSIVDGQLHCPLHGWRFAADGSCAGTPSGEHPPAVARLAAYCTTVVGGHAFFHTASAGDEHLPFFPDVDPSDLISAPPFAFDVKMPWWLACANGFDGQHFLSAHDRRLVGAPAVEERETFFSAKAQFEVVGGSWRDRLTRVVAGPRVEMTVRHVCGTMVQVASRFRRTLTFGLVSVHPRSQGKSRVHVVIWMPRRRLGVLVDALDVRVRAQFIRAFLQPDIEAGNGIQFSPDRLIGADALLGQHQRWLRRRERTAEAAAMGPSIAAVT